MGLLSVPHSNLCDFGDSVSAPALWNSLTSTMTHQTNSINKVGNLLYMGEPANMTVQQKVQDSIKWRFEVAAHSQIATAALCFNYYL